MNCEELQSVTEPDPGQGAYGEDQFRIGFGGELMAHGVTTIGAEPGNPAPPWSWLVTLFLLTLWGGCAAPGARQGTVEAVTRTDLDAAVKILVESQVSTTASLAADVRAVGVDLSERITQASNTTQKAVVAYSRVDQSTSDKWLNRGLVVGLVALAVVVVVVATYPVGKRRWLRANFSSPARPPKRPP